jgi:hypothetical protein
MLDIFRNRRFTGVYLAWIFIHFAVYVWTKSQGKQYDKEDFWPLTSSDIEDSYDGTEFILYTITPVVVIIIIKLLRNDKKD